LNFRLPALRGNLEPARWCEDLLSLSGIHSTVTGVLAGFCITATVFLVQNLLTAPPPMQNIRIHPAPIYAEATVGLFLVAFVGYIGTAVVYTVVIQRERLQRFFLYAVATSMYHFSTVLAFLGFYPLTQLAQLELLKDMARLTLIGAAIGGFCAAAIPYRDLLRIRSRWIFLSLLFSCATSLLFARFLRLDSGSLIDSLPSLLTASCLLIIVLFSCSAWMFFFPHLDRYDKYLPGVAMVVLYVSTSFALCIPILFLRAVEGLPRWMRL
jgi:hypothetical protein